jgi:trehalose utilization protein
MTYEQAMQNNLVTAFMAKAEIEKHGLEFEEFVAEYGESKTYSSRDVLIWMGY